MQFTRREFTQMAAAAALPKGKADACILLWLGGGAAQIDTFDPKRRGDGKKIPGSYYNAINTAIRGVQLTEHLEARRCISVRTGAWATCMKPGCSTSPTIAGHGTPASSRTTPLTDRRECLCSAIVAP
jgi:hypothetical protein